MDTLIFVWSDLPWARARTPRTRLACPQNGRRATVVSMIPAEVHDYLERVDGDRGEALRAVFDTVAAAMPDGFELGMHFGMPGWVVPLSTYPVTYNKLPLSYVSVGAQKRYNALYLMGVYTTADEDRRFREAWAATGRTLDMGKSCLRYRTIADVDLGLIAEAVAGTSVDALIDYYERAR